jgi:hypothetical protein
MRDVSVGRLPPGIVADHHARDGDIMQTLAKLVPQSVGACERQGGRSCKGLDCATVAWRARRRDAAGWPAESIGTRAGGSRAPLVHVNTEDYPRGGENALGLGKAGLSQSLTATRECRPAQHRGRVTARSALPRQTSATKSLGRAGAIA